MATQTGHDNPDFTFNPDKMTVDKHCYECKVRYRDPKPQDLVMYLHAWKYQVNNESLRITFYSCQLPRVKCFVFEVKRANAIPFSKPIMDGHFIDLLRIYIVIDWIAFSTVFIGYEILMSKSSVTKKHRKYLQTMCIRLPRVK